MPLTGKQKRFLRAKMVTQPAIIQIGKAGLNPNLIIQIDDALTARELVKIKLQNNSSLELEETAREITREVEAELVQLIGSNMVLYRRNIKEPKIAIPTVKTPASTEPRQRTRKFTPSSPARKTSPKKSVIPRSPRNENTTQGYAKPEARR